LLPLGWGSLATFSALKRPNSTSGPTLGPPIKTLETRQQNSEPLVRQYFGIQYSGLKALVSLAVHALWPNREDRRSAGLLAKPRANFIGPPQCPVIPILAL
jgi:hypothetical protein